MSCEHSKDGAKVAPHYTAVVDDDRKYVHVSDSFCELLGYKAQELLGRRFDELTAPKTCDIPLVHNLFMRLGYMHGLWMLVHRTGGNILVRYEAWRRSDSLIESNMDLVRHIL